MITIKMKETTLFEGVRYTAGEIYDVADNKAYALGSSVDIIGRKEIDAPPVDKMVKKAPKIKNI